VDACCIGLKIEAVVKAQDIYIFFRFFKIRVVEIDLENTSMNVRLAKELLGLHFDNK
jgi:hypothetical protein